MFSYDTCLAVHLPFLWGGSKVFIDEHLEDAKIQSYKSIRLSTKIQRANKIYQLIYIINIIQFNPTKRICQTSLLHLGNVQSLSIEAFGASNCFLYFPQPPIGKSCLYGVWCHPMNTKNSEEHVPNNPDNCAVKK